MELSNGEGQVTLNIESDLQPSRVQIWQATAPTLDFRDAKWTSTAAATAIWDSSIMQPCPRLVMRPILGEAVYHEGTDKQFWLSTNVRILKPDAAAE